MMGQSIYGLLSMVFGVLYPAFKSFKAIREKNPKAYVYWMMYWIIFALFTCIEPFANFFIGFWCPFYEEIKLAMIVWLVKSTQGATFLYRKFVHPYLCRYENDIDYFVANFQTEAFRLVLSFGSRGLGTISGLIFGRQNRVDDLTNSPRMNLRLIRALSSTSDLLSAGTSGSSSLDNSGQQLELEMDDSQENQSPRGQGEGLRTRRFNNNDELDHSIDDDGDDGETFQLASNQTSMDMGQVDQIFDLPQPVGPSKSKSTSNFPMRVISAIFKFGQGQGQDEKNKNI